MWHEFKRQKQDLAGLYFISNEMKPSLRQPKINAGSKNEN